MTKAEIEKYCRQLKRATKLTAAQKRSVHEYAKRYQAIRAILYAAVPKKYEELAAEVSADLADLYRISRRHIRFVNRILKLKMPVEREKFEDLFIDHVHVELLFHCNFHLRSLAWRAPRFWSQYNKNLEKKPR